MGVAAGAFTAGVALGLAGALGLAAARGLAGALGLAAAVLALAAAGLLAVVLAAGLAAGFAADLAAGFAAAGLAAGLAAVLAAGLAAGLRVVRGLAAGLLAAGLALAATLGAAVLPLARPSISLVSSSTLAFNALTSACEGTPRRETALLRRLSNASSSSFHLPVSLPLALSAPVFAFSSGFLPDLALPLRVSTCLSISALAFFSAASPSLIRFSKSLTPSFPTLA